MLTILHTESSAGWGGQENRTIHECAGLRKRGERVIVLCRPGSRIGTKAASIGVEVRHHPLKATRDVSAVGYILNLIKKEGVDVVSTHSGVDSFLASIAARLSRRRPVIVRTRHLALPITSKSSYSVLPMRVVAVSEHVRRHLVEEKGISPDKVVVIPTGIDLAKFDPKKTPDTLRGELGLDEGALIVGTVAIFRLKKGHHLLLEAVPEIIREVPEAVFVFAGEGPQRENILKRTRALGLEGRVRLLGLRGDVPTVLKGLDLFVLPTLQEALGTSILEASAMGRAVVSTRVGGVPEVVSDGETGLLVEPGDKDALAGAVIRLLKDAALRRSMGEAGRRMVLERYSTETMVEGMHELYLELVSGRKS